MIFGDGASAIVLGVAPEGEPPDIEYMQTYASGPVSQVNSISWPNPAFANNVTVFAPR
jgi:3-oxoacyl-[acyl-carrier-protein] synthase-3